MKIWNISIDEQFVEGCRIRQLMGEKLSGRQLLVRACHGFSTKAVDSTAHGEDEAVGPTAFGQSVLCVGILV